MKKIYKKVLLAIGVWIIRWGIRTLGPIWPKSQLKMALAAFDVLDQYYGHPVDIDDRVTLLLNARSEKDRMTIYQGFYDQLLQGLH